MKTPKPEKVKMLKTLGDLIRHQSPTQMKNYIESFRTPDIEGAKEEDDLLVEQDRALRKKKKY